MLFRSALAWPEDGTLRVRCLAAGAPGIRGDVTGVELVGVPGKLAFRREAEALVVTLPARRPCDHAWALRITGLDLAASAPVVPPVEGAGRVRPQADGRLVLGAADAVTHGKVSVEARGGQPNLGRWDSSADWAAWKVFVPKPGTYDVAAETSALADGIGFVVEAGGAATAGKAPKTGAWDEYVRVPAGRLAIPKAGEVEVVMRPQDPKAWRAINLRSLTLTPVP